MFKRGKIKLILSIMILSLITGGVFLPLDFALSQSYMVDFEGHYLVAWGTPIEGIPARLNYIERSINLPHYGQYEVRTYYNANSGQSQLYEEFEVLVDGIYIGQTSDPNITLTGPDYENEYLGEHDFTAGNHQVRLRHAWNSADVGAQSVHLKNVTFTLTVSNYPPIANAGPDKELYEEQSVILAGSGSDPDGDPITYYWSCTGGHLSNRYIAQPVFTAPQVSSDRTYTCTLTVTDDGGLSDSDSMTVTVRDETVNNSPPYANAGPDKELYEEQSVILAGSGSDPDGDPITYYWSCTGGSLSNRYTVRPTFNAPSVSYNRTYTCTLTVTDDGGLSDSDSMTVTVRDETVNNSPPYADAGPDKEVYEDESVRLDGSGSDPDGDPIDYSWSCTGGSLSNRYTVRPTFNAPSVSYNRTYTCTLTVTDDGGLTDSDSMRVKVLSQEEEACSKTNSSCSNPNGYIYLGDTKSGCLNDSDWKYYKVRQSSGEKIKVEISWSGTGCNLNDLYIYGSSCNQIYSQENNSWSKTWEGTPSSDIIVGLDGDSSNNNCQWSLKTIGTGQTSLTVQKSAKNLSRGDTEWYNSYRSASSGDELLFRIVVKVTGDTEAKDVMVRDTLPSKIIYQGDLEINGVSNSKNITKTTINIGDLSPGESKTITFEAKVAAKEKFSYGTTELINSARAYTTETSDTDTFKVIVRRKGVAGVVTGISTGIFHSLLLPLGIALLIVWIFKSKLIGLDKWAEGHKREIGEYRVKKTLKRKIAQLKSKGYFKE